MIHPIKPGERIKLPAIDPDQSDLFPKGKKAGLEKQQELQDSLADLQERFYVSRQHKLLIVIQGMDTSGKDGTIRAVFRSVNPQGVHVASFKRPSPEELSHDYLWRIHQRAPGDGDIVIFNRSHYEDVTAVRVNKLKPRAVWSKRFEHIRQFEQLLADEGTIILKFFLHIDRDAQRERLESRLSEPHKRWKFEMGDLETRKHWDEYMEAFEDAIRRTSTKEAPWYVVPSNRKWLRNLIVASVIVERLKRLKLTYPEVDIDPASIAID